VSLFTDAERWEMFRTAQAKLNAENQRQLAAMKPKPKTRAEILVEVAQEFAPCTTQELAEASGMSTSWVRKHLRAAGIVPAKPVRQKKAGQP
jgi:predicted ArsR family transcriptional regulator